MPSKGVLDYRRQGNAIVHVARVHSKEVGERLQALLAEVLEDGETLPDIPQLQLLFARLLEKRLEDLMTAEDALDMERADDHEPRKCRDSACAALRDQVVKLRALVRGVLGADREWEVLGSQGPTAAEPLALQRQTARLLERLGQPGATLLATSFEDQTLDLSSLAETLREKLDELDRALATVDLEKREVEVALRRRNKALDTFDDMVRGLADTLRGWFRLAGLPQLARPIRRTSRPPTSAGLSRRKGD